jgi:hypothetical protein
VSDPAEDYTDDEDRDEYARELAADEQPEPVDAEVWLRRPASDGWMENYPLHLVKKIALGGKDIDPKGRRVAIAELKRRSQ